MEVRSLLMCPATAEALSAEHGAMQELQPQGLLLLPQQLAAQGSDGGLASSSPLRLCCFCLLLCWLPSYSEGGDGRERLIRCCTHPNGIQMAK